MQSILHSLNQDESAVRRIAEAVEEHKRRERLEAEQRERQGMAELEALR